MNRGSKNRQSNFELLRIVCMIMVVMWHILGHGQAMDNTKINSLNYFIINFFKSLSIIAVNCYIMISGFFGIRNKMKFNKILKIYFQVLFYSVTISVIFWITGIEAISLKSIIDTFLPVTTQVWWFITIFLVLYILTPYINEFLINLSFKRFTELLIILFFIFTIWPSAGGVLKSIDSTGGYSLYNFIFLYMIGAYIRLYYNNITINKYILLTIYLLSSLSLCIFNVVISRMRNLVFGVYNYNFILVIIQTIALFLFFSKIKIESKLINKLSSLTFGVYLIHDHPYVRRYIYESLNYQVTFNTNKFVGYTILLVLIIYIGSSLIEYLRQKIFLSFTNMLKIRARE